MWSFDQDDAFIQSIISEASSNATSNQKKIDSKVVVVLELPVGGAVSKYTIGETDDTLQVTILKHSLMLNPKALLFSGIKAGIIDNNTDGPLTARGGIRLNECAKALAKYKSNNAKPNQKGELEINNTMTVSFDLPDFVSREDIKHYSYCFQQSDFNKLQYTITYFEFNTKDSVKKKQDENFTKACSMLFSNNPGGNGDGASSGGGNSSAEPKNDQSSSNRNNQHNSSRHSGGRSSNQFNTSNQRSYSYSSSSNTSISGSSDDCDDDGDTNMNDDCDEENRPSVTCYSEADMKKMKEEMEAKWGDYKSNYIEKVREAVNRMKAKNRNQMKEELKRQLKDISEKIDSKNDKVEFQAKALERKDREMRDLFDSNENQSRELNELRNQLEQWKNAYHTTQQSLDVAIKTPRVIHTHSDYISDVTNSATPAKRTRKDKATNVNATSRPDETNTTVSDSSSSNDAEDIVNSMLNKSSSSAMIETA